MFDMDDILAVACGAILFEEGRDGFAGRVDVDGLEVAVGVPGKESKLTELLHD
jgi:hypothetical protein